MEAEKNKPHKLRHIAVLGAAGGLGQALLEACQERNISFTAIVRSRPERIQNVPKGSRVFVVPTLADSKALEAAFTGAEAIISAIGVTKSSRDPSTFLSCHMKTLAAAMKTAGVSRLMLINTLLAAPPGKPTSWPLRFFAHFPGTVGVGAREQQAVLDAIGRGELSGITWTVVRAGMNSRGKNEPPLALPEYDKKTLSLLPVSSQAMARWILEEAIANNFVCASPVVSRRKGGAQIPTALPHRRE